MIQTADERRIAPRGVGKYLAQIAIVFAVQFAAGKLGDALAIINSGGIGPVWPASGVALAALLLFGYQVWPGVAAGAFLLAFLSPIPHIAAVVYAAGTTLAALTGTFLLRRVVNFDHSLSRLRDALGLIVFGAFGSSIVSACVGVSLLYAAHVRGWSGFGRAWLIYWLGDSMGVLLVTPLVLTFPNLLRIRPRIRIAEFAALLLLLTVACFIIFSDLAPVPVKLDVLAFAVLPFVIWAAIRFGVSGAALSTLFIASIAAAETASGSGPFDQNSPFINAAMLDVFFAVLSVSGLMLAATIAEREQAEREREQLVREQAAMEARLRLATIVESSDDAIIGEDVDGMITDWNTGAERLYGYSTGEVIGKPISLLVPPDRAGDFAEIMDALRRGNPVKHYETVCQRKDGTRIEVSLTASPIIGAEGRIVGGSAIAHDITERKRAEKTLRESEERFRLAAKAGKIFAYEWDAATDVIVRSAEAAQILGIDEAAHLTGQQVLAKVHPDDREGLLGAVACLCPEKPHLQISYRMVRPDGTVIWVERNSRAHFDEQGRLLRIVGMVADITERKLAEERLREYEKAVEGSEEMIAVVDREYRYLIANRKFLNLRNMTKEQVVGRLAHEILNKGVFEAGVKGKLDECFRGKVVRYEMKYTYPELGERDIFVSYFPIEGATGIDRVACILQDITERKRAEEALSCVNRRVIEAEERERYRIAKDLHEDIGQRVALLAIGIEQLKNDLPHQAVELLDRMDTVWKETLEILTDVKASAHELYSPRLEYLGIAAVMRSFCEEFGERKKVKIDFRNDGVPSLVQPDVSICLFRVLQEALHNGVKHSGVQKFEVQLWGGSDEIHLTVSDCGVGFDLEAARKGRGLGLTRMEQRVKLVEGEFSINPQPEKGTTVHVSVPLRYGRDSMRAAG